MSIEDSIDILIRHPRRNLNRRKFLTEARTVLSFLRQEGYLNGKPVEVSVVFGTDPLLRSLKKKYFGKAYATDVVAFPQVDRQHGKTKRGLTLAALNPRGSDPTQRNTTMHPVLLGDVVISLDHAKKQAKDNGHSYSDEVLYLFIHGMLHLLGFRDAPAVEAARMTAKQNALWDTIRHEEESIETLTKRGLALAVNNLRGADPKQRRQASKRSS